MTNKLIEAIAAATVSFLKQGLSSPDRPIVLPEYFFEGEDDESHREGWNDGITSSCERIDDDSFAQVLLAAISDAGFAVAPRDPTEAMLEAARDVPFIAMGNGEYIEPDRSDIYRAMINATTTEES